MKVSVTHRFAKTTVDEFVRVYYSAEFNRAVASSAALSVRELVDEQPQPDGTTIRRVKMVPDVQLPGPIARLLDGPIEFFEVSVYDPATRSARYHVESAAGDAVKVSGVVRFEQDGDDVVRTIDGEVEVKVFGLGGLIERFIGSEVKTRYDRIQDFTQRYLDARRAGR